MRMADSAGEGVPSEAGRPAVEPCEAGTPAQPAGCQALQSEAG